jgi:acetyl esterase/lipase
MTSIDPATIGTILAKYEGQRQLAPAALIRRPPNPPLNTGYIQRKWLDVPYAEGCPRALMDIYLPNCGEGPYPVILFAHGGGYFTGDKGDYETYPPLEGLKRGYAVCAINYTLSGEALFPRQLQEAKAAVRFIRARAAEYHLDTTCIIAWGMSAGANLVSLLATTGYHHFPELEDYGMGHADQPCHVDACMIWFCPTDLGTTAEAFAAQGMEAGHIVKGPEHVMSWYLGLPPDEYPDLSALTNPESYITAETPPFVIQHGKPDRVVPYLQAVRLAEKLGEAIGADKVRLTLFEDYIHADRRFETMHNCSLVLDQLEELLGRK